MVVEIILYSLMVVKITLEVWWLLFIHLFLFSSMKAIKGTQLHVGSSL